MMASLKSIASAATSLYTGFSMVKDFFGYRYYDSAQTFIDPLSLKKQMRLAKGRSIHLSVLFVGNDGSFGGNSVVTRQQALNIQTGIQRARDLYAQAPLGIRKIFWSWIRVQDSGDYIDIADSDEAEDLTDDWHGGNSGIDVFFVQTVGGADGWSTTDGPCDKESIWDQSGVVIALGNPSVADLDYFGVLIAHEVGHYLGLKGGVGAGNLMGADNKKPFGVDEIGKSSTNITSSQAKIMRKGCFVKNAL